MNTKKKIKNTIIKSFNYLKKNIKGNIQINLIKSKETNIQIKNQKIENINIINNQQINIKVINNYKKCIFQCNNLNKNILINCINYINSTIKNISKDKYNKLIDYNLYNKKYESNLGLIFNDDISINEMIDISKNIEKNTLNLNKNIISEGVIFNKNINYLWIYNDYKKIKYFSSKFYFLIENVIIKNKNSNNMEYDYEYIYSHKLTDLITKYHFLSKIITKKISKKLNIQKILTQIIPVVFNNEVSTEIFKYLIKSINGHNIYNKTSFMLKKMNKKILPKWMNIIENPFIYKGIGSKPFDTEGSNTYKYNVVKKGILKTWILDSYSSKKLNKKNTCNSGGIHNWCFIKKKKNINLTQMIKKINKGLIIDKLLGQGVNITTGLYSKGASGYWIEKGKITFFTNEITISGNFKKLFLNIKNMSNDINIYSNIRTGSILISKIKITSKK